MSRRTFQPGMTLVELVVAVAILAIMVMGFSQILDTSQDVVSKTQIAQRQNATVEAVAEVIRNDLKKITKNGFLCICKRPGTSFPSLVFSTAGYSASRTRNVVGLGGITVYSLQGIVGDDVNAYGVDAEKNVLLRKHYVLNSDELTRGDVLEYDLANIQIYSRIETYNLIDWVKGEFEAEYNWPPTNLNALDDTWQVLGAEITRISIEWTDGEMDDSELVWYGLPYDGSYTVENKDDYEDVDLEDTPTQVEFGRDENGLAIGGYHALWTHANQTNWPVAIKVSFSLSDPAAVGEDGEAGLDTYEVIVPIE